MSDLKLRRVFDSGSKKIYIQYCIMMVNLPLGEVHVRIYRRVRKMFVFKDDVYCFYLGEDDITLKDDFFT
jgi:hypothetical protein